MRLSSQTAMMRRHSDAQMAAAQAEFSEMARVKAAIQIQRRVRLHLLGGSRNGLGEFETLASGPVTIADVRRLHRTAQVRAKLSEICVYTVFLLIFTWSSVLVAQDQDVWHLGNNIRMHIADNEFEADAAHVERTFYDVQTVEELHAFLRGPFFSALYLNSNGRVDGRTGALTPTGGYLFGTNKLLGGVRIGQYRATTRECDNAPGFTASAGPMQCVGSPGAGGDWTADTEDRAPFGSRRHPFTWDGRPHSDSDSEGTTGTGSSGDSGSDTAGVSASASTSAPGSGGWGSLHMSIADERGLLPWPLHTRFFSSSGKQFPESPAYPVVLPNSNGTEARRLLEAVIGEHYVDAQTRAFMVDLTVYNGGMNMFVFVRLVVEQSKAGGALPSYFFSTVRLYSLFDRDTTVQVVAEVIVALFVCYYIAAEVRKQCSRIDGGYSGSGGGGGSSVSTTKLNSASPPAGSHGRQASGAVTWGVHFHPTAAAVGANSGSTGALAVTEGGVRGASGPGETRSQALLQGQVPAKAASVSAAAALAAQEGDDSDLPRSVSWTSVGDRRPEVAAAASAAGHRDTPFAAAAHVSAMPAPAHAPASVGDSSVHTSSSRPPQSHSRGTGSPRLGYSGSFNLSLKSARIGGGADGGDKGGSLANLAHNANLASYVCVWVCRLMAAALTPAAAEVDVDSDVFFSYRAAVMWRGMSTNFMSVTAFASWFKLVRYLAYLPQFSILGGTLRRSAFALGGFGVVFGLVMYGFAAAHLLVFGTHMAGYRNLTNSFLTLIKSLLGDFDLDEMTRVQFLLGPLLFVSYVGVSVFVVLSILIAIVSEAYNDQVNQMAHSDDVRIGSEMVAYVKARALKYKVVRRCVRRGAAVRSDIAKSAKSLKQRTMSRSGARMGMTPRDLAGAQAIAAANLNAAAVAESASTGDLGAPAPYPFVLSDPEAAARHHRAIHRATAATGNGGRGVSGARRGAAAAVGSARTSASDDDDVASAVWRAEHESGGEETVTPAHSRARGHTGAVSAGTGPAAHGTVSVTASHGGPGKRRDRDGPGGDGPMGGSERSLPGSVP